MNPLGFLKAPLCDGKQALCTQRETMDQKYERIPIFRCRRKLECPEKTYQGGYGIGKTNSHIYNHWPAALVRALNQRTRLATGVVCHPKIQNRISPTKSPDPARNWTGDLLHRKRKLHQCAIIFFLCSTVIHLFFMPWTLPCSLPSFWSLSQKYPFAPDGHGGAVL